MENEKWKSLDFIGLPNYQVSDMGRVKSFHKNSERILVGGFDKDGYRQVVLCEMGYRVTMKVYRLVALAFVPNPTNLKEVNHLDENKSNDKAINLVWSTRKECVNRGTKIERAKKTRLNNAKGQKKIACYTTTGELIKTYKSASIASLALGVTNVAIHNCCKSIVCTCCGMIMRYFDDEPLKNIKVSYVPVRGESNNKKIAQYDKSGMFICVWESVEKASKILKINSSHIASNCTGYRNSKLCGGYMFRYVKGDNIPKQIEPYQEKAQKVAQYSIDGELIKIWNNAEEVGDFYGIRPSNIRRNCNGKVAVTAGYVWEYLERKIN